MVAFLREEYVLREIVKIWERKEMKRCEEERGEQKQIAFRLTFWRQTL